VALAEAILAAAVAHAMSGRQGTAVVLEVRSGAVLAAHRLEAAERLLVRPGSTIKPFVPPGDERIPCGRHVAVAGRNLDCSHTPVPQAFGVTEALAYSCNYYFAARAAHLREGELEAALRRAIPTARAGSIERARTPEERQLMALGEARMLVTPMAMLQAYRRIALERGPPQVVAGLEAAAAYGTARLAAPAGLRVAGKTGTSTEPGATHRHAWFIGYAPAEAPAIAVLVFLDQGRGGADAAPIAREIFAAWRPPHGDEVTVRTYWLQKREAPLVRLPLESYVAAVLAGESNGFRSAEALKAMAVAARTFAMRNRRRHASEGFDFCDTTHCQDFRQVAVTAKAWAAVEATRGELLWYQGSPATVYYHAECAGSTEAVEDVWGGNPLPYLGRRHDPYCVSQGNREWRAAIAADEVSRALARAGLKTPALLRGISVVDRTASGRAAMLRLRGDTPASVSASSFRFAIGRALGWDRLPSTWFQVERAGDQLVVLVRGRGHGVGLCQTGADAMGDAGQDYRAILDFYFPGTTLGKGARAFAWRAQAGERVEVLTTRPERDRPLVAAADRTAREAEARTGLTFRERPQVRLFPTVAAFRDATGEPGWVAASTRGRVVRMQPPRTPDDGTLLHEFIHMLLESRAHTGLPLWFREGLVLHLITPEAAPVEGTVEDRDFRQARTQSEMARVYARARSRVQRMVARHGREAVLGWVASGLPVEIASARE
jgi:stage II sporulation protein D